MTLSTRGVALVLVCGITVLNSCGKVSGGQPAAHDMRLAAASSWPPGTAAPLVIVPPDSPQTEQLRIEPVRAQAMPTAEVAAPARVIINPNRIARVLPAVQGRVVTVSVKLGDSVAEGQPLVT